MVDRDMKHQRRARESQASDAAKSMFSAGIFSDLTLYIWESFFTK